MSIHRTTRALSATALGLTLAFTAAACGEDTSDNASTQVSTTDHNDPDVAFATDMLQHHAQALSMVDLTQGRTLDPAVQQIAEEIRDAQAPEIETFSDWLTDWDEPVPATMRDHANADAGTNDVGDSMEGIDTDMPGMMTADEMTALENTSDADFQTRWLEMMVEHHTGAVDMARTEIEDGQYKPAIELANSIAASQTSEIDTMNDLLHS